MAYYMISMRHSASAAMGVGHADFSEKKNIFFLQFFLSAWREINPQAHLLMRLSFLLRNISKSLDRG